ncbi:hypothetical protein FACS1894205_1140 [Alphaproteobacteria bacterium]|nr:hypothetical protein FACS1894205_1140 [Alphaproteobacteria bacterium]
MLHEEKAYPTLLEHLSACRPAMSFGLSPNARRVIIVAFPDEWDAARDYVSRQCPKGTIAGFCPIGREHYGDPLTSIPDVATTSGVSLLAPTDLPNHLEACVLVFCSASNTETYLMVDTLLFHSLRAVGHVFVYPEIRDDLWSTTPRPDFFNANGDDLEWVYVRLADTESKVAFAAAVKAAITGNMGYIRLPGFTQYRHPLVWPRAGDVVIDAGVSAAWLDPTIQLMQAVESAGRVYGFEPDPTALASIRSQIAGQSGSDNFTLVPMGLFSHKAEMQILTQSSGGSCLVREESEKTLPCQVIDLDSFVKEQNLPRVDVVKMDIEGSEGPALRGMAQVLREWKPRLMISAYHNKLQDMVTLPRILLDIRPDYQIRFATSLMYCGEFLYYAT